MATAETKVLDSAGNAAASKTDLDTFLSLTGFKSTDVIASNAPRRTFVTEGGGKYVLSRNRKSVRVASGPAYPKLRDKAEEEDDE